MNKVTEDARRVEAVNTEVRSPVLVLQEAVRPPPEDKIRNGKITQSGAFFPFFSINFHI